MKCRVERRLGRLLARDLPQPGADLLEREGVVAEQRGVLLDERERRLGRLVVAVDRRCLAPSHVGAVTELDLDDVLPVAGLSRDHEGLRETEPADGGLDLHARELTAARASLERGKPPRPGDADSHRVGSAAALPQLARSRCDAPERDPNL